MNRSMINKRRKAIDSKKEVWYVYILECRDGALYTGITNDLVRRLDMHRRKLGGAYTRSHGVKRLRYSEVTSSRSQALTREYEIKQMKRLNKIALIRNKRA